MSADDHAKNTSGYQKMDREERDGRDFLFKFLDFQFALPDNHEIRQLMMELMQLQSGDRVLDVGCALGGAVLEIAGVVGAEGQVTGLDLSKQALIEAERRAADLNLPVDWVVADAHNLPFSDDTFDAARSERTFMHFSDPRRALQELVRVIKPGGRIVVCDPDHRTTIAVTGEPELYAKLQEHKAMVNPDGRISGTQHPLLFQECGLNDIVIEPRLLTVRSDDVILWRDILGTNEPLEFVDAGDLTDEEYARLLADHHALVDGGLYCFAVTIFIVAGTVV